MDQNEIAEIAQVSRSTISRVENGKANLRLKSIRSIEEHFGESIDSLLGISNEQPDWLEGYQGLSQPDRETVDRIVRTLVEAFEERSKRE